MTTVSHSTAPIPAPEGVSSGNCYSQGFDGPVHVAITRVVRVGKELEFEFALKRFIQRSLEYDGTCGAQVVRPAPHTDSREYGVLRSFRSAKDRDAFYASQLFAEWEHEVRDLVEGTFVRRTLHGLEAFFHGDGYTPPPPRWKMATVTWLGVWPLALTWALVFAPLVDPLHISVKTALSSTAIVGSLAWVIMPTFTKLFRPWLSATPKATDSA